MENNLELDDIQGFAVKGYSYLEAASYKMIKIKDADSAKQWIGKIISQITTANRENRHEYCANLSISYYGLQALRLSTESVYSFDLDFQEEGFASPITQNRLRTLGDIGTNAPENWEWGGNDTDRANIHLLLMLFAKDDANLKQFCEIFEKDFDAYQLEQVHEFFTHKMPNSKEHFGFRDSIAQPEIEGYSKKPASENVIKAGEFILGYVNEYNILPESPYASEAEDKKNILPTFPNKKGYKDIGKNGTYIVFRQLEQDVKAFWSFIKKAAQEVNGYDLERLGAKIVGRWRSGAPITKCPIHDNPDLAQDNDFNYAETDTDGMKCPIGAHIRRSNPRDAFMKDAKKSVLFAQKHRLMRRGRSYGKPFVENFDLNEILTKPDDGVKRGLYFLAVNANFGRQFNFIQQAWVNDGAFQGLSHEPDVLLGSQTEVAEGEKTYFSMPQEPIRQRIEVPKAYIRVRGSMNFFLPSMRTLQWIANL